MGRYYSWRCEWFSLVFIVARGPRTWREALTSHGMNPSVQMGREAFVVNQIVIGKVIDRFGHLLVNFRDLMECHTGHIHTHRPNYSFTHTSGKFKFLKKIPTTFDATILRLDTAFLGCTSCAQIWRLYPFGHFAVVDRHASRVPFFEIADSQGSH